MYRLRSIVRAVPASSAPLCRLLRPTTLVVSSPTAPRVSTAAAAVHTQRSIFADAPTARVRRSMKRQTATPRAPRGPPTPRADADEPTETDDADTRDGGTAAALPKDDSDVSAAAAESALRWQRITHLSRVAQPEIVRLTALFEPHRASAPVDVWNAVFEAHRKRGQTERVWRLYQSMKESKIKPNLQTFEIIIRAHRSPVDRSRARELFESAMEPRGLYPTQYWEAAHVLLSSYGDIKRWDRIKTIFDRIRNSNAAAATASAIAAASPPGAAPNIVAANARAGAAPSAAATAAAAAPSVIAPKMQYPPAMRRVELYTTMISLAGRLSTKEDVLHYFSLLRATGLTPSLAALNTLLFVYAKIGDMSAIQSVFDELTALNIRPDLFSYTILISAFGVRDDIASVFRTFKQMTAPRVDAPDGIRPDARVLLHMIDAIARASLRPPAYEHPFSLYEHVIQPIVKYRVPVDDVLVARITAAYMHPITRGGGAKHSPELRFRLMDDLFRWFHVLTKRLYYYPSHSFWASVLSVALNHYPDVASRMQPGAVPATLTVGVTSGSVSATPHALDAALRVFEKRIRIRKLADHRTAHERMWAAMWAAVVQDGTAVDVSRFLNEFCDQTLVGTDARTCELVVARLVRDRHSNADIIRFLNRVSKSTAAVDTRLANLLIQLFVAHGDAHAAWSVFTERFAAPPPTESAATATPTGSTPASPPVGLLPNTIAFERLLTTCVTGGWIGRACQLLDAANRVNSYVFRFWLRNREHSSAPNTATTTAAAASATSAIRREWQSQADEFRFVREYVHRNFRAIASAGADTATAPVAASKSAAATIAGYLPVSQSDWTTAFGVGTAPLSPVQFAALQSSSFAHLLHSAVRHPFVVEAAPAHGASSAAPLSNETGTVSFDVLESILSTVSYWHQQMVRSKADLFFTKTETGSGGGSGVASVDASNLDHIYTPILQLTTLYQLFASNGGADASAAAGSGGAATINTPLRDVLATQSKWPEWWADVWQYQSEVLRARQASAHAFAESDALWLSDTQHIIRRVERLHATADAKAAAGGKPAAAPNASANGSGSKRWRLPQFSRFRYPAPALHDPNTPTDELISALGRTGGVSARSLIKPERMSVTVPALDLWFRYLNARPDLTSGAADSVYRCVLTDQTGNALVMGALLTRNDRLLAQLLQVLSPATKIQTKTQTAAASAAASPANPPFRLLPRTRNALQDDALWVRLAIPIRPSVERWEAPDGVEVTEHQRRDRAIINACGRALQLI